MAVPVLSSRVGWSQGPREGGGARAEGKGDDSSPWEEPFLMHLDLCISKGPLASHEDHPASQISSANKGILSYKFRANSLGAVNAPS